MDKNFVWHDLWWLYATIVLLAFVYGLYALAMTVTGGW